MMTPYERDSLHYLSQIEKALKELAIEFRKLQSSIESQRNLGDDRAAARAEHKARALPRF